jgi:tRNA threonylcarbamoyladenosine biosynthesis protein TsaB
MCGASVKTLSELTFSCARVYNCPVVVLALDTTTRGGSVAVARGSQLLGVREGDPGRPHATRLPRDVMELLQEAGLGLSNVDLFVVASGPGTFTGLRIGIATIQGLAFANNKPVVGVSALDALAWMAVEQTPAAPQVAAWMDASRGEVFGALYAVTGSAGDRPALEPALSPTVLRPETTLTEWARLLERTDTVFVGGGALLYRSLIASAVPVASIVEPVPPLAPVLARLAIEAARRGEAGPPHTLRPLYIRRPDAELARARRSVIDAQS